MGRTEPSLGRPPASFRRAARAKRAKVTLNQVIPSLLSAHPRARRGIEAAELIVNPPPVAKVTSADPPSRAKSRRKGSVTAVTPGPAHAPDAGPRLTLRVADTLTVAHDLLRDPASSPQPSPPDRSNRTARVAVLNMASPLAPGGGFVNGATGHEASLCARTTLLPSLRDAFYRLPELGAVYTPDVLVFRGSSAADADDDESGGGGGGDDGNSSTTTQDRELRRDERWFVDCVTAAAPRLPETEVDESTGRARYVHESDRELLRRKMRVVLRVCAAKGVRKVVLGAWGCGAYGNPVAEVAAAWRGVLLGPAASQQNRSRRSGKEAKKGSQRETWDGLEEVVFAIREVGMAEAFAKAFGDGLAVEETAASGDASGDEEEDDDEQGPDGRRREDERELRRKVEELEGRIEQARDPRLKSGLQAVLAGLRDQMMDYRDAKSDAGSGEDEDSDDQDGEGEVDDDDEEDGGEEASGEEDEEGSFTDQSKGGQAGTRGQLPPIDR